MTTGKGTAVYERRVRARFGVDGFAEVIVSGSTALFRGVIQDLSHNGCYIKAKGYLCAGTGAEVEVRFSVNDLHFSAPAFVTAVRRGSGARFEFLHREAKSQIDLDNLIAKLIRQSSVAICSD